MRRESPHKFQPQVAMIYNARCTDSQTKYSPVLSSRHDRVEERSTLRSPCAIRPRRYDKGLYSHSPPSRNQFAVNPLQSRLHPRGPDIPGPRPERRKGGCNPPASLPSSQVNSFYSIPSLPIPMSLFQFQGLYPASKRLMLPS